MCTFPYLCDHILIIKGKLSKEPIIWAYTGSQYVRTVCFTPARSLPPQCAWGERFPSISGPSPRPSPEAPPAAFSQVLPAGNPSMYWAHKLSFSRLYWTFNAWFFMYISWSSLKARLTVTVENQFSFQEKESNNYLLSACWLGNSKHNCVREAE